MKTPLSGLQVLYVHGDHDAAVITGMLETAGAAVRTEASGWLALSKIRSMPPDVIITDLQLAGYDGAVFIQRMRASGRPDRSDIPAIALSSAGSAEEHREALAAGYSGYLAWPADLQALVNSITHQIHDDENKSA